MPPFPPAMTSLDPGDGEMPDAAALVIPPHPQATVSAVRTSSGVALSHAWMPPHGRALVQPNGEEGRRCNLISISSGGCVARPRQRRSDKAPRQRNGEGELWHSRPPNKASKHTSNICVRCHVCVRNPQVLVSAFKSICLTTCFFFFPCGYAIQGVSVV